MPGAEFRWGIGDTWAAVPIIAEPMIPMSPKKHLVWKIRGLASERDVAAELETGYAVYVVVGGTARVFPLPISYHFGVYTKVGAYAEARRRRDMQTSDRELVTSLMVQDVAAKWHRCMHIPGATPADAGEGPVWKCAICDDKRMCRGQPLLCPRCLGCCTMLPRAICDSLRPALAAAVAVRLPAESAAWKVVAQSVRISEMLDNLRAMAEKLSEPRSGVDAYVVLFQCSYWFFSQAEQMVYVLRDQSAMPDAVFAMVRSRKQITIGDPSGGLQRDAAASAFRAEIQQVVMLIDAHIKDFDDIILDGVHYPVVLTAQMCAWLPALRAIRTLIALMGNAP